MGLFDFLKKKTTPIVGGDKLDKLTPEGELPWGWHHANREFTQKIDNEYRYFSEAAYAAKKEGVRAEYAALKSLVLYMEDVRKLCDSKGECFSAWASLVVANPITYQQEKERLQYMEANMADLLKREKILNRLRIDILQIIEDNPGILQTEVYKRFPSDLKNDVSNELYQLGAHEEISREKHGRTYRLHRIK